MKINNFFYKKYIGHNGLFTHKMATSDDMLAYT